MPIRVSGEGSGGWHLRQPPNISLFSSLPFGRIEQNSLKDVSAMFIGDKEQVGMGVLYRYNELLTFTYISTEGLWVLHFLVQVLAMVARNSPAPHAFARAP